MYYAVKVYYIYATAHIFLLHLTYMCESNTSFKLSSSGFNILPGCLEVISKQL